MNLCPYFPQLLSDFCVIRHKTPARSAVGHLSCINKMCDIGVNGVTLARVPRNRIAYVLEVENALVTCTLSTSWFCMLVCAHSSAGVTLSVDMEFLNVSCF
jgi:hypothetical protein